MKHKVGQLVINRKLGLGKVLEVRGDNVTVFFKDQTENPRIINVGVVPMTIPKQQYDPDLDEPNMSKKRSKAAPVRKNAARRKTARAGKP